jgi:hypothetical protein
MPIHWTHDCPPDSQIWTELLTIDGAQVIRVTCDAPGDPPAPPAPPDSAGTVEGVIGSHRYTLDWAYTDGAFQIQDLDLILSLDGEIG